MIDKYIFIIEIIGTIAFASSGAMVGIKKQMDLLGVCVLGMTTAVGGGMIRDLILGVNPPVMFQNPTYALLAIAFSVIISTTSLSSHVRIIASAKASTFPFSKRRPSFS